VKQNAHEAILDYSEMIYCDLVIGRLEPDGSTVLTSVYKRSRSCNVM